MDTSNILFICGGAFVGLEDIVKKRIGSRQIGFFAEGSEDDPEVELHMLEEVTTDDVLEYGMIPELVGRLPVLVPLTPLSEEALVRILTEPKNALVKQYQHFFGMEGAELEFTESALIAIAHRAMDRDTGARALRAILEEAMMDLMFELPDMEAGGTKFIIDVDVIHGLKAPHEVAQEKKKESA